jgi:hypothetical protein
LAPGDKADDGDRRPEQEADRLHSEITSIRGDIGGLLHELGRRKREALDVKKQLKKHPTAVSASAATLLAVAAGLTVLLVYRHRRQQRLGARLSRLREAVSRMMAHPRRVARVHPRIPGRIVSAVGAAAAGALARDLAHRLTRRPPAAP